jgi:hypothetical protein
VTLRGLAAGLQQPDSANPGSPNTGTGTAGDEFSYQVEVPADTGVARFDLDAIDQTADLDLIVYLLDGDGGSPVAGWQSASGSASELIDLVDPDAGFYRVIASVYSGTTGFDVTTYSVLAGAGEGDFTATPAVIAGEQGIEATVSLGWTGLAPETGYLGLVGYGDTAVSTVVSVESGAAPEPQAPVNTVKPSIVGTAEVGSTLRALSGEWDTDGLRFGYQWQVDGVDISTATTSTYKPSTSTAGKTVSVVVTATARPGAALAPAQATSAGVLVKFGAKITLKLSKSSVRVGERVDARVSLSSDGAVTGQVTVSVGDMEYPVTLDNKGNATMRVATTVAGTYAVTANYAGSADTAAGESAALTLHVRR